VTLSNADRAEYGAIVVDPAQSEVIAAAHLRNLARNAIVHNGVLDTGVQLISKPFTLEQLALKIREVLDT